jgi:nitrite reductase/ring-hydroxylating ferredoxin subunit
VLSGAGTIAMAGGLVASYGTLAAMAGRYLYPARGRRMRWQFLLEVARLAPGSSISYRSPSGERIAIARQGEGETADDFIALSSTCPHLGCQVHWEGHNDRFFCPCHNGVFDPQGKGISGPPGDAQQSLGRYGLEVRDGLLYIEVPMDETDVASAGTIEANPAERGPTGPGHDPCLGERPELA